MNQFRKNLLDGHLRQLTFPMKDPVRHGPLRALYTARKYAEMADVIRKSMNLGMRLRLGLVNSGGPDAPAWINRPDPMPRFGSREFMQATVTMYIRKDFIATSCFEELVTGMAHELSHVVLESIGHALRKSEEAVDLTAMILGYRDFYRMSCTTEETSEHIIHKQTGYLSSREVTYAANCIAAR